MDYDGEAIQPAAIRGVRAGFASIYAQRRCVRRSRHSSRTSAGEALVHIPDIPADPVYAAADLARALVELGGMPHRSDLPLRKDSAPRRHS